MIPAGAREFYWSHYCRSADRIQERLELVKSALPLPESSAQYDTVVP